MGVADLMRFAKVQLASLMSINGAILYSSHKTLKLGPIYLLGLNPGGNPNDHPTSTIANAIDELATREKNSYVEERWQYRCANRNKAASPLQKRIIYLLAGLGCDPKEVCASNLIFVRSVDASGCGYPSYADICWPVHEKIIEMVKPKLIIAYGNSGVSPYAYLRSISGHRTPETYQPAGHGNWQCKAFKWNRANGDDIAVVGLPHLSRYKIDKISNENEVVRWIRRYADL
ncbi:hypothetical protein SAMN04488068_1667 [Hydrocarboniphaga daqingensis]|uniref:Uracil DNA glycosylase superfamily protein n=1 Tax=Hydrocarboniphaga daqingensis TaxID=490188 RepID=A0A1M5N708_9GAMM|nr:hypothetical protein [Hydrocarboniphaga daqingensis]SHG85386.1 hypothetical protein SAMN04488068_1667 [Hydrocarboniphaga daqingensis]